MSPRYDLIKTIRLKIMNILSKIQKELKAPKNQRNNFGKYNYRSCEDILEAVKPLLEESHLILNDEIVEIGGRFYVKATATLTDNDGKTFTASAFAREEEVKKGMDGSQITGSSSSYARKYALNGLFCIDDNKDADASNSHGNVSKQPISAKPLSDSKRKEIQSLTEVIGLTSDKVTDAIKWSSGNRTADINGLSEAQADKLVKFLKSKLG